MSRRDFGTERKIGNFILVKVDCPICLLSFLLHLVLKMGLRKLHRALQHGLQRGKITKGDIASRFFFLEYPQWFLSKILLTKWWSHPAHSVIEWKFKRWKGFNQKLVLGVPMPPPASKRSPHNREHISYGATSSPGKANVSKGTKSWPYGAMGNGGPKAAWLHWVLAWT